MNPYDEDLAQAALRAHGRTGNTEGIKARLRALQTALSELGDEPGPDTFQLARDLLSGTH